MKTTHNTYPAYQYDYKGFSFKIVNYGIGRGTAKWYIDCDELPERETSEQYSKKSQALDIAKYLIDKKLA